jgi:hypothetical protein
MRRRRSHCCHYKVVDDDGFYEDEPLPVDYAAMPRPQVSCDSEFIFPYLEEELAMLLKEFSWH